MKKNLYYRTMYKRTNIWKVGLLNLMLSLSSWPRLMLEVFLRTRFGERYFSFSGALFITLAMAILPILYNETDNFLKQFTGGTSMVDFIWLFTTWYVYLAWFLYMTLQRREEIKRFPSVFDFGRFSLSTGHIHSFFWKLKIGGRPVSVRTIETTLEPAVFAIIGLLLSLMRQPIGPVLLSCSIIYSLSYVAAYYRGDQFIMDKIDEMICNEEMVSTFVEGRDASQTRGVSFYGRRPSDPETRRKLAAGFIEDDVAVAQ